VVELAIPQHVIELIERFDCNRDAYCSGEYNETETRREFIDPLFRALGWDIDNEAGYAEAYKDVVHEDVTKVGGATKAPDYAFRIGGTRKFFVEAKRPGVNIKEDTDVAYIAVPARGSPVFPHVLPSWSQSTPTLECGIGVERSRGVFRRCDDSRAGYQSESLFEASSR
jgi:hypothetical protein